MRHFLALLIAAATFAVLIGCADIKVDVPDYSYRPKVDARQVPPTKSHSDCRQRLTEAYSYIRHLEDKVDDLKKDKKKLKDKIDHLEDRLDRYED